MNFIIFYCIFLVMMYFCVFLLPLFNCVCFASVRHLLLPILVSLEKEGFNLYEIFLVK